MGTRVIMSPKLATAARGSKVRKQARLVKRKVCFILDAGTQGGVRLRCKGQLPPLAPRLSCPEGQWARASEAELQGRIDAGKGPTQKGTVGSGATGGLTSIVLTILRAIDLQFRASLTAQW